eukprot:4110696-Amphidinium_carterae.1
MSCPGASLTLTCSSSQSSPFTQQGNSCGMSCHTNLPELKGAETKQDFGPQQEECNLWTSIGV